MIGNSNRRTQTDELELMKLKLWTWIMHLHAIKYNLQDIRTSVKKNGIQV